MFWAARLVFAFSVFALSMGRGLAQEFLDDVWMAKVEADKEYGIKFLANGDNQFCGVLYWLANPKTCETGSCDWKLDVKNPNSDPNRQLQKRTILGLTILNLSRDDDKKTLLTGRIYLPDVPKIPHLREDQGISCPVEIEFDSSRQKTAAVRVPLKFPNSVDKVACDLIAGKFKKHPVSLSRPKRALDGPNAETLSNPLKCDYKE
jgi:hypothetical protein